MRFLPKYFHEFEKHSLDFDELKKVLPLIGFKRILAWEFAAFHQRKLFP